MLFCTSLVAFVGAGEQPHLSPRKLSLLNTHSNAIIQNLSFPSTVLEVQLNRKRCASSPAVHRIGKRRLRWMRQSCLGPGCRLVAVLERRALVYDLESLHLLGTLDTPANPHGLASLTACCTPADLLALPAGGGALRVYDMGAGGGIGVDVLCELEAHKAPLVSRGSPRAAEPLWRSRACPVLVWLVSRNGVCCVITCRLPWPGTRKGSCLPLPPGKGRWCVCTR